MSPSRRCSTGSDPAAGFALLIMLWVMALLALLGSQLVAAARGNIAVAHNLRIGAEAEAASYGAVQEAIFHLLDRSGRHWSADGTVHQVDIGTVHALVTITDDGSKLNLNLASPRLLQALLLECGADSSTAISLAAAIVDWRTPGSQARARGAKAPQYAAAGRNYAPPGAPFRSVAELQGVLGMTPRLMARIRPHLTVFTDTNPDRWSSDAVVDAAVTSLNGARPPMSGNDAGAVMIATIQVRVSGMGSSASRTEAVIRLNARPRGLPYEILAFQRPAD